MVADRTLAAVVFLSVSASFPFFLYGAWIMIDAEVVTWDTLVYHLKFIVTGLTLTTVPLVTWMLPRLFAQIQDGLAVVHAFFGLQAYALLAFGLTGIVRIVQAKRAHDLYEDPDQDVSLSDLHENADAWRSRLRVGVFGYTILWVVTYLIGAVRFVLRYGDTFL